IEEVQINYIETYQIANTCFLNREEVFLFLTSVYKHGWMAFGRWTHRLFTITNVYYYYYNNSKRRQVKQAVMSIGINISSWPIAQYMHAYDCIRLTLHYIMYIIIYLQMHLG
ncbi:hypothetical protein ACJX0J_008357, partial [Zea mays]